MRRGYFYGPRESPRARGEESEAGTASRAARPASARASGARACVFTSPECGVFRKCDGARGFHWIFGGPCLNLQPGCPVLIESSQLPAWLTLTIAELTLLDAVICDRE
ncbi:hypothetical protein AGIG_G11190 [Arapaima gigas]